jgi:hypothetical protein
MSTYEDFIRYADSRSRASGYLMVKCPYHDDSTASLAVRTNGGWRCYGCGLRGTWEPLLKDLRDGASSAKIVEKKESVVSASRPIIPEGQEARLAFMRQAHRTLIDRTYARRYLDERGVNGAIETSYLGWHQGWIVIPIGDVVYMENSNTARIRHVDGLVMRATPLVEGATGMRFHIIAGQKPILLTNDRNHSEDYLFVVFGLFDYLSLDALGYPVATPTCGKLSLLVDDLPKHKRVILIPDEGEETEAFEYRRRIGPSADVLLLKYPCKCKDPNDLLRSNGGVWSLTYQLNRYLDKGKVK